MRTQLLTESIERICAPCRSMIDRVLRGGAELELRELMNLAWGQVEYCWRGHVELLEAAGLEDGRASVRRHRVLASRILMRRSADVVKDWRLIDGRLCGVVVTEAKAAVRMHRLGRGVKSRALADRIVALIDVELATPTARELERLGERRFVRG